jgi:DNA-binding NarL/FixJ family response regulator
MTDSPSSIRVLVVEDNAKVRNALAALLDGSPGFTCAGACESAEAALRRIPTAKPDLILVDLELPGQSGTELLRICRSRFPGVELLVLTVHDEADWVFPALAAGASGYVIKGTAPAKLLEAISEVRAGGSFMSGCVARRVLRSFQLDPAPRPGAASLSPRELDVLARLARGLKHAEIAAELGISRRTVNTHLYHIYEKLHVHSAAGAVGKMLERQEPDQRGPAAG